MFLKSFMTVKLKYTEAVFCSLLITKSITKFNKKGLKQFAEKSILLLLKLFKFKHFFKNPIFYYLEAIELCRPILDFTLINTNLKKKCFIFNISTKKSYLITLN